MLARGPTTEEDTRSCVFFRVLVDFQSRLLVLRFTYFAAGGANIFVNEAPALMA